ncbi:uncharacterized protein ACJ7VT_007019 [Polymixia lowei]
MEVSVEVLDEKNETDVNTWLYQLFHNHLERCMSPDNAGPGATNSTGFLQTTSVSPSYDLTHKVTETFPSYSTTTTPYNFTKATLTEDYTLTNFTTMNTVLENVTSSYNHSTSTHMILNSEPSDVSVNLFQGIEVSCLNKTRIRKTNCTVLLKLKQPADPCCILSTLCVSGNNSMDIHVMGKRVERVGRLPQKNDTMECNSFSQYPDVCISTGPANDSCDIRTYVPSENGSAICGIAKAEKKVSCNCSAYCNGTAAYYAFQISIQDSTINVSYVSSLISLLRTLRSCSQKTNTSCPPSIIASTYKDANVNCGVTMTNLQSCRVILSFARELPVCEVSIALMTVFYPEEHITYYGNVSRAAICGNSGVEENPLKSNFTWFSLEPFYIKPSLFCEPVVAEILTCQNGTNSCVLLEQCDEHILPPVPTSSPNATTSALTTAAPNATITTADITVTTQPSTTITTGSTTNSDIAPMESTTAPVTSPTESQTTAVSIEGQANELLEQTRDVSNLNSSQVDQLVSQLEGLLAGPNVSLALGNTSIHIVSNLLDASPDTLASSSSRIIGIVDTVGLKLVFEGEAETILSQALALSVKSVDGTNFQETFFSISDPSNVLVRGDSRTRRSVKAESSTPQGSIKLPPSLTQDLTSQQQQQASRVQFNFYQKSTVFQDRALGARRLISGILGASVANLSISGLQDDVVIHLKNSEPIPANFVASCVFWDFALNDGSGGWNPNGCFVRNSTDKETICSCNHLTSFAILLDISRDPITSRLQATILTYITYIGCGISAIFLSVTLLTYLAFGKLRKDIPSKILIQLCLALLLLNLVFLVDAWLALYPDAVGLCISTAWFLHYFLLASFTWMGLEAVHMYLALVKVFNAYISRYMLKFSLIGWGIPLIVVIVVIAVDKDNYGLVTYGKFADGTTDDFCWLKNDIAFYVAVVAYFCVIFLFNLIMFFVVMVQLCRIKRQNPHNAQHRTTLQDMRSVAGITILLGLTWGFAFFAWGPVNLAFMYLFAIFNSLQGFFIFVFHCAVKENVRRQWRTYLCCGRLRLAENSEWSRTATQKTTKKSSVTRVTSLHSFKSSQSNNSSFSSFLASDSSEQLSGVGSPFEDRAITADEDPRSDVILNEINRQNRTQQAP